MRKILLLLGLVCCLGLIALAAPPTLVTDQDVGTNLATCIVNANGDVLFAELPTYNGRNALQWAPDIGTVSFNDNVNFQTNTDRSESVGSDWIMTTAGITTGTTTAGLAINRREAFIGNARDWITDDQSVTFSLGTRTYQTKVQQGGLDKDYTVNCHDFFQATTTTMTALAGYGTTTT